MDNAPTFVDCTAGQWTLVANAIQSGVVHIKLKLDGGFGAYLHYWKKDGQAAPTATDHTLGVPFRDGSAVISADEDIDVYVFVMGSVAGRVRVDK